MEIELETGAMIKLTTDEAYKEKGTKEIIFLDYKNLPKVLEVGKRVFIDDGLISILVKEICELMRAYQIIYAIHMHVLLYRR